MSSQEDNDLMKVSHIYSLLRIKYPWSFRYLFLVKNLLRPFLHILFQDKYNKYCIYIFVFRQIVLSEQSIVMCFQIDILLLSSCVLYIPY